MSFRGLTDEQKNLVRKYYDLMDRFFKARQKVRSFDADIEIVQASNERAKHALIVNEKKMEKLVKEKSELTATYEKEEAQYFSIIDHFSD